MHGNMNKTSIQKVFVICNFKILQMKTETCLYHGVYFVMP